MPRKRLTRKTGLQKLWATLNTPFVVVVLSAGIFAGLLKVYDQWQASISEVESRRAEYGELITEYNHRISMLEQADRKLDAYLGDGLKVPSLTNIHETEKYWRESLRGERMAKPIPCGPFRKEWIRVRTNVGLEEQNILKARSTYIPTTMEFRGVDFATLVTRIERVGGMLDIQLSPLRQFGTFDGPPDSVWMATRAFLPTMAHFGASRDKLYSTGELPLRRGASLTEEQEATLGIIYPSKADLERIEALGAQVQEKLKQAQREVAEAPACPGEQKPQLPTIGLRTKLIASDVDGFAFDP